KGFALTANHMEQQRTQCVPGRASVRDAQTTTWKRFTERTPIRPLGKSLRKKGHKSHTRWLRPTWRWADLTLRFDVGHGRRRWVRTPCYWCNADCGPEQTIAAGITTNTTSSFRQGGQGPLKTVVGRENRIFERLSQKRLENTAVKALWPNTRLGRALTITSVTLS